MYRQILVPFDGSKYAKNALDEAIGLAKITGARVHLFTVVNISGIVPPGSLLGLVKGASAGELQRRLLKSAETETEDIGKTQIEYCKSKGVDADYEAVLDGNTAEEILRAAKKKSADLIVIGSHGLHGIGKIKTLGSVSRKVSEFTHCPVLIVR